VEKNIAILCAIMSGMILFCKRKLNSAVINRSMFSANYSVHNSQSVSKFISPLSKRNEHPSFRNVLQLAQQDYVIVKESVQKKIIANEYCKKYGPKCIAISHGILKNISNAMRIAVLKII